MSCCPTITKLSTHCTVCVTTKVTGTECPPSFIEIELYSSLIWCTSIGKPYIACKENRKNNEIFRQWQLFYSVARNREKCEVMLPSQQNNFGSPPSFRDRDRHLHCPTTEENYRLPFSFCVKSFTENYYLLFFLPYFLRTMVCSWLKQEFATVAMWRNDLFSLWG